MPNEMPETDVEKAEEAISSCVRAFYIKARHDDLLGPVFNGAITDWDHHLSRMDDFWSTALLGTNRYQDAPFPPHLKLDMGQEHFDRWRDLWSETSMEHLPAPLNERAAMAGNNMAHCWGRAFLQMKEKMTA